MYSFSSLGPPLKKIRLTKLTLTDAVEEAKLTNKAITNGDVVLSLLDEKERVTVLELLGQKVESGLDPFKILFKTACILQKTLSSDGKISDTISVPSVT